MWRNSAFALFRVREEAIDGRHNLRGPIADKLPHCML